MATCKGRSHPIKRESRPAMSERLPECLLGGDIYGNTTTALRLQRIAAVVGLTGARANGIAGLAWGEVHHG